MVEHEFDYIDFLVSNGLQRQSANSYRRYLISVSKHLQIDINRSTISSEEKVSNIIDKMSGGYYADSFVNNCGTALRRYLKFVNRKQDYFSYPEEIVNPSAYIEGAKKQVVVNSYERDRDARNKAIEIHGMNCFICDMSFEDVYGEIGVGFIHVHHLKPLHTIDKEYNVDPEYDLITVCPNCHAMIHRLKEQPSKEDLKKLIKKAI
ncbi:MAG TPA: hypothetical protein VH187_17785 [Scandinavium sp.]|jgi:5-methylcytosine-specific restriction protein A|uniref:HNH endonuclease n=1 Tax=Scandinavium sp. TaxID=2830653 RepID=UPI002E32B85D|nr:hypothetical protein [Scandinavium sp.]HEX4502991.1 hypothetical protein [Scandinavium sp.]